MNLSNSELNTFMTCRRQWYVKYYLHLAKKSDGTEYNGALNYGTRIHKALEGWYIPDEAARVDPRQSIVTIYDEQEEIALNAGADMKKFANDRKSSIFLVEYYMKKIDEGLDDEFNYIAAEQEYKITLGKDLYFRGQIDAIVERKTDGARFVMDHKTYVSPEQNLLVAQINPQFLGYMALYRANNKDYLAGSILNIFRKVKTERTAKEIIVRETIRHNQLETDNHLKKIKVIAKEIKSLKAKLDKGDAPNIVAYPNPTTDCSWRCEFLPVCHMFDDGSYWQEFLDRHYVQYDPNARYNDKVIT